MHRVALISAMCLVVLAGNAAAQLPQSETRALQIAALREFRALRDTTRVIYCVGIIERAALGRDPVVDPDSAFLAQIGSAERVRPISACETSQRDPDSAVTLRDRQSARVVRVWTTELVANHEARLWVWGHGGGWRCTFVKHETVWGKPDCQMIFQT